MSELKGDALSLGTGRRWTLRDALVAGQTAVTLVLLVAAGLLTRSILEARQIDLGFRTTGVAALSAEVGLSAMTRNGRSSSSTRPSHASERSPVSSRRRARYASRLPSTTTATGSFYPERHRPGDEGALVAVSWVDGEYFDTLAMPLLRGRTFGAADSLASPRVAVVNDVFVRTYWPGRIRSDGGSELGGSTVRSSRSSASWATTRWKRLARSRRLIFTSR